MRYFYLLCCVLFFTACWPKRSLPDDYYNSKKWAWKPVYGANNEYKKITWYNTPRSVTKAGKIYVNGNRIFQNDIGRGIHIIDNSNPALAKRIAFLEVPGSSEIAVRGTSLFTNNYMDIVEIDISNPSSLTEKGRVKNAFISADLQVAYEWQAPPDSGFYQCPSFQTDSLIVRWEKDSVFANCYKY